MDSDWVGLGYDGEPIVHGHYFAKDPIPKYDNQLAVTPHWRRVQREKRERKLTEMDRLWEGYDNGC